MSRSGSCILYGAGGTDTYGMTCPGNCCTEDCAETLLDFIAELQEKATTPHKP